MINKFKEKPEKKVKTEPKSTEVSYAEYSDFVKARNKSKKVGKKE